MFYKEKEIFMGYIFRRDFYNQMIESINNNSVTFLLGTRKCGKTVCLSQLYETLPYSRYVDFKTIADFSDKVDVFRDILDSINENEKIVYLLDEVTYVPNVDARICEIASALTFSNNTNTKIVFTGSQLLALNTWADRAFAGNVGKVSVDFLTYSEFLRYKGLTEISPNTYSQFLYEVADFCKFKSLEDYLKGCMEETIISNANTSNYIFDNDCDLIKDNEDVLVNLCYQTMFTLHNHVTVDTFFKNDKLRDTIVGTFHETCKKIGNESIAAKIEKSFVGSYNHIASQDMNLLKQAFVFLKKCGLITITPVTRDLHSVPDVYYGLKTDESDVNCKKDLFKKFNITINHPMFYVQILKDVLGEDMPLQLPGSILGSIVECHARGLLPKGFEYHSIRSENGIEREREIDYINLSNNSAVEFSISQDHSKNFKVLPEYLTCTCLTRNRNEEKNGIIYRDYCSYLYDLSQDRYLYRKADISEISKEERETEEEWER